jgi:hypothetical protein
MDFGNKRRASDKKSNIWQEKNINEALNQFVVMSPLPPNDVIWSIANMFVFQIFWQTF